ncbi:leucine rich repeat family protein, partial [Cystoisospora suis]
LWGPSYRLSSIDFRGNALHSFRELLHLAGLHALRELKLREEKHDDHHRLFLSSSSSPLSTIPSSFFLEGNLICHGEKYRDCVLFCCPGLRRLDEEDVQVRSAEKERKEAGEKKERSSSSDSRIVENKKESPIEDVEQNDTKRGEEEGGVYTLDLDHEQMELERQLSYLFSSFQTDEKEETDVQDEGSPIEEEEGMFLLQRRSREVTTALSSSSPRTHSCPMLRKVPHPSSSPSPVPPSSSSLSHKPSAEEKERMAFRRSLPLPCMRRQPRKKGEEVSDHREGRREKERERRLRGRREGDSRGGVCTAERERRRGDKGGEEKSSLPKHPSASSSSMLVRSESQTRNVREKLRDEKEEEETFLLSVKEEGREDEEKTKLKDSYASCSEEEMIEEDEEEKNTKRGLRPLRDGRKNEDILQSSLQEASLLLHSCSPRSLLKEMCLPSFSQSVSSRNRHETEKKDLDKMKGVFTALLSSISSSKESEKRKIETEGRRYVSPPPFLISDDDKMLMEEEREEDLEEQEKEREKEDEEKGEEKKEKKRRSLEAFLREVIF